MFVALFVASLLSAGQDVGGWKLTPQYAVGQEIVYKGRILERSADGGEVAFEQPYEFETTLLVVDFVKADKLEFGCFTVVRPPDPNLRRIKLTEDTVRSVHFDSVSVDRVNHARWMKGDAEVALPPNGIVPWELGCFLEVPREVVSIGSKWVVRPEGQPIIRCQVVGSEPMLSTNCVKVIADQESQNWTAESVSVTAWNNRTVLWIDPRSGVVQRVERTFRHRNSGDSSTGRTILTEYERTSDLRYHGPILQERVADFRAALAAQTKLEAADVSGSSSKREQEYKKICQQLKIVLDREHMTPYRPALLYLHDKLSDAPAMVARDQANSGAIRLSGYSSGQVGRKARSFVVHDVENDKSVTLKSLDGTAVLLVFIDPNSELSKEAMLTAQRAASVNEEAQLILVTKTSGAESVEALTKEIRKQFPGRYMIATGQGLDSSYGVKALPHLIYIDAEGVLRGNYVGVGPELEIQLREAMGGVVPARGARREAKPTFLR